ncbi:MAG: fibronectin type III domain-containing protein [Thermoguttaceae bacterium]|nr:fibronectin type III domain-containing protein [Thermoguttaceae bacterium]
MTFATTFISKLFSSNNANGRSRTKTKRNANTPRAKTLRFESLETREMLSASSISPSEYANIRAQYPDFKLPPQMTSIKIMELKESELSVKNLQSKIKEAEKSEQDDLIVIRTTNTANKIQYMRAADELKINFTNSLAGSITIVVTGPKHLTLDAAARCRVMSVQSTTSHNVNLAGITFTGGKTNSSGGGIFTKDVKLSLVNCTITNNQADAGGGVFGTSFKYKDCAITNNQARENGGAHGRAEFENCVIKNNRADNLSGGISGTNCTIKGCEITGNVGGDYGGLSCRYSTITNCTISNNKSSNCGGGLSCTDSTVTNCTISDNVAKLDGGGIWGSRNSFVSCTITNNTAKRDGGGLIATESYFDSCTVSGNKAKNGGGIYGNGKFVNSVIVNNKAIQEKQYNVTFGGYGGGVYVFLVPYNNGRMYSEFINCTIANNSGPTSGGGVYTESMSHFYNSILVQNTSNAKYKDCGWGEKGVAKAYHTMTSQAKKLWSNASEKKVNNYNYSSSQPLFKSKTDYHLSGTDSQAYNKGYNDDVSDFKKDRDGKTRIVDGTVDLGAYEVQPTKPTKPTIASKSATANTITVMWNAVEGATSYKVSIDGGQAKSIKKTQYTFSNLKVNTSHKIQIWAVNSAGTSNSVSVTVKTVIPTLDAPTIKSGTSASNSITLKWTALSGATGYTVKYWQVGSPEKAKTVDFSKASGKITGLKANTNYNFQIMAKGNGKEAISSSYGVIKSFKTTKANAKSNAILDEAFAELFNEDL